MNIHLKKLLVVSLITASHSGFAFEDLTKTRVTATAYNSLVGQTDDTPNIAAWNNKIKPGDKIIAVSRDLLGKGLTNGVKVKIVGIDGLFTVRDKMNKRWRKRIDIYMGDNKGEALDWGKRRVSIIWNPQRSAQKHAKRVTRIKIARK